MIVEDGKMTVHITLNSKNIVQLFLGTAEDAQKDGADLIDPAGTEMIEYTDGSEPKEVYTFDVPVKKLDEGESALGEIRNQRQRRMTTK